MLLPGNEWWEFFCFRKKLPADQEHFSGFDRDSSVPGVTLIQRCLQDTPHPTAARPSASRKECPLRQSPSLKQEASLLLKVPVTSVPVTWRWGARKKPAPAVDQHPEGHHRLGTPPLSRSPDCGSLPIPSLKQRAPNHHLRLPVSSGCALIYSPMSTPPSLSCRRLRADGAHPAPGLLPPLPSVPCHRPDTWGYGQSPHFSHVIPGTLWHVDGGADTGRGAMGRKGNRSLLTASSEAAWRGSRCCRCHAGSSGGVTANRWPRRAACTLGPPEGCLSRPPMPTQWPSARCGRSAACIALHPGCRSQPASSGSHCTASC